MLSLTGDTPSTAAGVTGGYVGAGALADWLDTSSAGFWVLVWFGVLLAIIWLLFIGALF
jgi:hypothetical protein